MARLQILKGLLTRSPLARCAAVWVLILSTWAQLAPLAWAAKSHQAEEAAAPPSKSYVIPYLIVAFGLGLGLAVICRPSGRSDVVEQKRSNADEE